MNYVDASFLFYSSAAYLIICLSIWLYIPMFVRQICFIMIQQQMFLPIVIALEIITMNTYNSFEIKTCRPNANIITAMCLWVQGNSAGLQECGRSTLTMGQYVWPYNGLPVIFFWSLFYLQNIFLGKQGWLRPIKKTELFEIIWIICIEELKKKRKKRTTKPYYSYIMFGNITDSPTRRMDGQQE